MSTRPLLDLRQTNLDLAVSYGLKKRNIIFLISFHHKYGL